MISPSNQSEIKMNNKLTVGLLIFLLQIGNAFGDFSVSLSVPLYGQDTGYYCGAASSQMIMMGYPNAGSRLCQEQNDIYNTIQTKKQDAGFYTDPDGLRDTIMTLNPPPAAGHFSIFSNASRDIVMHDMLYWMANRNYPSAVLINGGDHWVVVTGYHTDIDPRTGNAILQSIDVNDPLPDDIAPHDDPCTIADEGNEGGTVRFVTGASWFSNDFKDANKYGTKWLNKYVAVVEPPEAKGSVTAKMEVERGKVIPPKEAIALAIKQVKERKLAEKQRFRVLKDVKPRRALLANSEYKGYYIVPFESRDGRSPVAVLLNAYTGEFQEIGAFARAAEYLSPEEAIKIALCAARTRLTKRPNAELVFKLSEQVKSRYFPIWKITIPTPKTSVIRYVSQRGEVFLQLTPQIYGGD